MNHQSQRKVNGKVSCCLNVMIFDTFSRAGGGISYLKNIALALGTAENRKYDFIFVLNPAVKNDVKELERVVRVHYADQCFTRGGIWGFVHRSKALRDAVQLIKPDLLICMNQVELKFKNIPTILFLRNALYFFKPPAGVKWKWPLKQRLRIWYLRTKTVASIRNATSIMTATQSFHEMIVADIGKIEKPWFIAPFGYNQITKAGTTRDYERCERLITLQFNFYKGIDIAVHALHILKKRGLKFYLTVTDDLKKHPQPDAQKVLRLAEKLDVKELVACIGKIQHCQMASVYAEHDLFIFPSFIESFGHGLLEAMGSGLPCIASDIPVHREVCKDAALFADTGDAVILADRIEEVYNSKCLRKELGMRGISRATDFSWKRHIDTIECACDRILKKVFD